MLIKPLGLFALIIMCSSCLDELDHEPKFVNYDFYFSFQNISGNDLVKGIELDAWWPENVPVEELNTGRVKDSIFTLDIIVSDPCDNRDNNRPELYYFKRDNGYYNLSSIYRIPKNDCPIIKKLTYKLQCPYLFGDDEIHEFVTYWDIKDKRNKDLWAKCYRIEFEDRVIKEITLNGDQATIILDI